MPAKPHGGKLQIRSVATRKKNALLKQYASAPKFEISDNTFADLEMLGCGAMSPLKGFMGKADYDSTIDNMRLANGLVWPFPITLATDANTAASAKAAGALLLTYKGNEVGLIEVAEVYDPDLQREVKHTFRTDDAKHPGVAYVLGLPPKRIGGPVHVFDLQGLPFVEHRLTPTQTRAEFEKRGWKTVVAFQTRNPIHRAHEYLTKVALECVDGLMLHPLVGATKSDDIPADVRMQCYQVMMEKYYNPQRVMLSVFPAAMRYAGPREAIFHCLARKNYGVTHFIVGRDHAGVGNYYGSYDAQEIFDQFDPKDIGVQILKFENAFYCKLTKQMATTKTTSSGPEHHVSLSGTKVREMLAGGQRPPEEFSRPEVADLLIKSYQAAPAV